MKKEQKRSNLTSLNEEKIKAYIVSLDKDVYNLFRYTNSLPYSTTTTGGAGSASAGAQYVEITIGNVTYKVLHDGTV